MTPQRPRAAHRFPTMPLSASSVAPRSFAGIGRKPTEQLLIRPPGFRRLLGSNQIRRSLDVNSGDIYVRLRCVKLGPGVPDIWFSIRFTCCVRVYRELTIKIVCTNKPTAVLVIVL